MIFIETGKYVARQIEAPQDLARAQALRAICFKAQESDADIDSRAVHVVVEDKASKEVLCSFRLMALQGRDLSLCYAAQFYDLSGLQAYEGLMLELGRFCMSPVHNDPEILRLAWAAMTVFVDSHDVEILFGCASFEGVETEIYLDAFALLRAKHLAPRRWMPGIKARDVFRYVHTLQDHADAKLGVKTMPALLRTYLMMGGWVSDHAVVDHEMDTLHVFTALEIGAIPESRKRLLRALI